MGLDALEKQKNLFSVLVMKSPYLSCPAHSLVTTPMEQPQLVIFIIIQV